MHKVFSLILNIYVTDTAYFAPYILSFHLFGSFEWVKVKILHEGKFKFENFLDTQFHFEKLKPG